MDFIRNLRTSSHCLDGTVGSTGNGYVHTVHNVFYENKTYYVIYSTEIYTEISDGSNPCTSGTTYPLNIGLITNVQLIAYLQGTDGSTLKWTPAPAIYTGAVSAINTQGPVTVSVLSPSCSQGNWTNPTTFPCTYYTGTTYNSLCYNPVTLPEGFPGISNTYTLAEFVRSQYQQGILINNIENSYSDASTFATLNTFQFYNLTTGATTTEGGVTFSIANTYSEGAYSAWSLPYSEGWGLIDVFETAADTYVANYGTWFANGTTNRTRGAFYVGDDANTMSFFIDDNGALWAGVYSTDTTITTGYLGKLEVQMYSANARSAADAYALSTLLSFVCLFMVSIFIW